jgi:hypothetical protein
VFAIQAQAPPRNAFIGMWKLNLQKSRLQGSPPRDYASFRKYEDHGGGWMFHTLIFSYANGAGFVFAAARYDGKEYPSYASSSELGAYLATGAKSTRTVTFKLVDSHTLEFADRENGRVSNTGVSTVSNDGKVLTETDRIFDKQGKETSPGVAVYDKQ